MKSWLHHECAGKSYFVSPQQDLHTLSFGSLSYSLITGNKRNQQAR